MHRVIQVAVLFTENDVINETDIEVDDSFEEALMSDGELDNDGDLSLDAALLKHVKKVYELSGRNKSKTAKILGVSRSTLDRKLEEL